MSTDSTGATLESRKDFADTPEGQYQYYSEELKASQYTLKDWHKQADKIVNRYKGARDKNASTPAPDYFDLNLFHSNVSTLGSMLYGNIPQIDVSRRYAQSQDDVGRVAAEMMERLLNLDVADHGMEIDAVFRGTLQDRLLGGLGCGRVRYEVETEDDKMVSESAPIDYFYWGDVLWSWSRNFAQVRWIGFRNYLTKDEIEKRFGKHAADNIELKKQKTESSDAPQNPNQDGPWMKGEIWEIWDKTTRKVVYLAFGYHKILEEKDDPLQLSGFFPTPPFFMANPTTSLYIPTPDFKLAQDLYNEIDKLQERISIVTEAVKVVGVYDASGSDTGIGQMFKSGTDNDLIPVDNWALFAEKGGIAGQIDWLPLADIVNALDKLIDLRDQNIGLLQQITGMSDVMRGGLDSAQEGVGQTQMKAKFGSIRVQALQDQFARFASDLMQLKAEVIARHFSPETIVQQANMEFSADIDLVPQAVDLIKSPEKARLRIDIRPESVAMVDYAQLKNERTDYINALSMFLQSAAPMIEMEPASQPFLLQLLQWGLAGFKGASEIEGVIDKAIEASEKAAKEAQENPQPDPAEAQMKMQMEMQQQMAQMQAQIDEKLAQQNHQNDMEVIQAKAQADQMVRAHDLQADTQQAQVNAETKKQEIEADLYSKIGEIEAKMQADIAVEQVKAAASIKQSQAAAQSETDKNIVEAQLSAVGETLKATNKLDEIAASASAKIKEAKAKPTPKAKPKNG